MHHTTLLPEQALTKNVVAFLLEEGYAVRAEVPVLGKSADLVATRGRWVTVIEVKCKDWKKAIQQCLPHVLVADFVCIALGTRSVSPAAEEAIQSHGFGIIHLDPDAGCRWHKRPALNEKIWLPQRQRFADHYRKIDCLR